MIRVKICGVTSVDDALRAPSTPAPTRSGFNFYRAQPALRRASRRAAAIVGGAAAPRCARSASSSTRRATRSRRSPTRVGLDALQFHGDESAGVLCAAGDRKVDQGGARARRRTALARRGAIAVDFVLADAYVDGQPGGTGQRVPIELARRRRPRERLILAGGLTPDNVAEAVRARAAGGGRRRLAASSARRAARTRRK